MSDVIKLGTGMVARSDSIEAIRLLLDKDTRLTSEELSDIQGTITNEPAILNELTLSDFSRLSSLGVDVSMYVTELRVNNVKSFTFKLVTDSMTRISYLNDTLVTLERKFYDSVLDRDYVNDDMYLIMLKELRSSISSTMDLMNKLSDSESLMAMMYVQMDNVVGSLDSDIQSVSTRRFSSMARGSRKKVTSLVEEFMSAVNNSQSITEPVTEPATEGSISGDIIDVGTTELRDIDSADVDISDESDESSLEMEEFDNLEDEILSILDDVSK